VGEEASREENTQKNGFWGEIWNLATQDLQLKE
jgi:hypothetical protein